MVLFTSLFLAWSGAKGFPGMISVFFMLKLDFRVG